MVEHSIQREGFGRSILLANDGTIIAGNATVEAAASAGLEDMIIVESDGTKVIAVKRMDVDPGSERFHNLAIADNRAADLAEWDADVLRLLQDEGQDLDQFFRDDELNELLASLSEPPALLTDPDDVPPLPSEPITKPGDLWVLGKHRLLCGDATVVTDVERLMGGEKADMVFTDPPYGYEYQSNHQRKHVMLVNDDTFLDFLPCAYLASSDDVAFYVFAGWQTVDEWIKRIRDSGLTLKNIIVWKKNNWSMGDLAGAYAGQYELCLFAHKGRVELQNGRDRDVWEFDREPPTVHPTIKPIDLCVRAITNSSRSNDLVLDLFGGSGSTLIACEQTARRCAMLEIDPHYCDVIRTRFENATGQTAVLESLAMAAD